MRWPWWYQPGVALLWALVFAAPFRARYFPQVHIWPVLLAVLVVACVMQFFMKTGSRDRAQTVSYACTRGYAAPPGT